MNEDTWISLVAQKHRLSVAMRLPQVMPPSCLRLLKAKNKVIEKMLAHPEYRFRRDPGNGR